MRRDRRVRTIARMGTLDTDTKITALRAAVTTDRLALLSAAGAFLDRPTADLVVFLDAPSAAMVVYTRDEAARAALERKSPGEIMSLRSVAPPGTVLVRVADGEHFAYVYERCDAPTAAPRVVTP